MKVSNIKPLVFRILHPNPCFLAPGLHALAAAAIAGAAAAAAELLSLSNSSAASGPPPPQRCRTYAAIPFLTPAPASAHVEKRLRSGHTPLMLAVLMNHVSALALAAKWLQRVA